MVEGVMSRLIEPDRADGRMPFGVASHHRSIRWRERRLGEGRSADGQRQRERCCEAVM